MSEAIALQRKHLHLDGSRPHVRVRRAIVKRRVEPPKTKYGRRSVPLPASLVSQLRAQLAELEDAGPDALLFPSTVGTPLDPDTIRRDFLKAAMEEIDPAGLGFHAQRHTYASLQLAAGVNVLQLSRALGHHSAAFTLSVYTHLPEGDEAPALDLTAALERGNDRGNEPHRTEANTDALVCRWYAARRSLGPGWRGIGRRGPRLRRDHDVGGSAAPLSGVDGGWSPFEVSMRVSIRARSSSRRRSPRCARYGRARAGTPAASRAPLRARRRARVPAARRRAGRGRRPEEVAWVTGDDLRLRRAHSSRRPVRGSR